MNAPRNSSTGQDANFQQKVVARGRWAVNALSVLGRLAIVYLFVGAAQYHLSSAHWMETITQMRHHGLPAAPVLLIAAMAISSVASLALLFSWKPMAAAYVLSAYTLVVSAVLHNPFDGNPIDFILFVKDLGIAGSLLVIAAALAERSGGRHLRTL